MSDIIARTLGLKYPNDFFKNILNERANGNMVDTTGYSGSNGTVAVVGGELVLTSDGNSSIPRVSVTSGVPLVSGNKYFVACDISTNSDLVSSFTMRGFGSGTTGTIVTIASISTPMKNHKYKKQHYCGFFTQTNQVGNLSLFLDCNFLSVTCTFTNGTDVVNKTSHGLSNGTKIKFSNSGGALPTGLSSSTTYYIINKNDNDFQISLTVGGAAVDFSSDGSGTNSYYTTKDATMTVDNLVMVNMTNYATEILASAELANLIDTQFSKYIDGSKQYNKLINRICKDNGKKIAFMGDSIMQNYNIPDIIANLTGVTAYNYAVGGTNMIGGSAHYTNFSIYKLALAITTGTWTDQDASIGSVSFGNYTALKAQDFYDIDKLVIFIGTNDFIYGTLIGTNTDVYTDGTIKGAMNTIVNLINTKFPHVKIYFVAPMWRQRQTAGDGKESDANANAGTGLYLVEYADAMLAVGNLNHCPVLDMYRNCGVNKYNYAIHMSDGLHPNSNGALNIAEKLAGFIVNN